MAKFKLNPAYTPTADQPKAIDGLAAGLGSEQRVQTLLGATGTGKTFTMAAIDRARAAPGAGDRPQQDPGGAALQRVPRVLPRTNAVEYFVSYYDYYQPEAYVPAQDLYIEKDSSINDEIDRLRHSATASLFARKDVIIVASVSCIYGIGSPKLYRDQMQLFKVGDWIDRQEVFRKLVGMQYRRNDTNLGRGTFSARGEVLEIMPAYAESAYRIQLFGDEIEAIQHFDPLTGEVLDAIDHVSVWPASHYVTEEETLERSVDEIERELSQPRRRPSRPRASSSRPTGSQQRTKYDMEMLRELGFCSGIENYSRILDGRPPGSPPYTLIDYFPDDFVTLHRRVPPDDPADRRHVRGRLLAQVDPRRLRLPAALGDRQPPAQVRRVPRPRRPDGAALGDAGAVGARRSRRTSSSRSCARPGSSTPRSRSARPRTRSTT